MKTIQLLITLLFSVSAFSQVELLKDINPFTDSTSSTNISESVIFNNRHYMIIEYKYSQYGFEKQEIWSCNLDFTDFQPMIDSFGEIQFSYPSKLTLSNSTLFFTAYNENGLELWKSDGTIQGTSIVKDIVLGQGSSDPSNLVEVGNEVYFVANSNMLGFELWKTNGTEIGTLKIKEFQSLYSNSKYIEFNNELYFGLYNWNINEFELWKSDGTESGTLIVENSGFNFYNSEFEIQKTNSHLFFNARHNSIDKKLFSFDGNIFNELSIPEFDYEINLVSHNNYLYYKANNTNTGITYLCKTDGTSVETQLVFDISNHHPGATLGNFKTVGDSIYYYVSQFDLSPSFYDNSMYVFYNGTIDSIDRTGITLYSYVNIDQKTAIIGDLGNGFQLFFCEQNNVISTNFVDPNPPLNVPILQGKIIESNGKILSTVNFQNKGAEPVILDLTNNSKLLINDFSVSMIGTNIESFTEYNGKIYFSATSFDTSSLTHQFEPWVTDGTTTGTHMLTDIIVGNIGSYPVYFEGFGDTLLIFALSPTRSVYKYNLSTNTMITVDQKEFVNGSENFKPKKLNNKVYFIAEDSLGIWNLNTYNNNDGLITKVLNNLNQPVLHCNNFAKAGDKLFFDGFENQLVKIYMTDASSNMAFEINIGMPIVNVQYLKTMSINGIESVLMAFSSDGLNLTFCLIDQNGVPSIITTLNDVTAYNQFAYNSDEMIYTPVVKTSEGIYLYQINSLTNTSTYIKKIGNLVPFFKGINDTFYYAYVYNPSIGNELYSITNNSIIPNLISDVIPGKESPIQYSLNQINNEIFIGSHLGLFKVQNGISTNLMFNNQNLNISEFTRSFVLNNRLIFTAESEDYGTELMIYDPNMDTIPNEHHFISTCDPYTWNINNHTHTSSGIFKHTIQNQNLEDSITYNLHLIKNTYYDVSQIGQPFVKSSDINTCNGEVHLKTNTTTLHISISDTLFTYHINSGVNSNISMCNGIYSLSISDSCGNQKETPFVIPLPEEEIIAVDNTNIKDSLGFYVENCEFDFSSIDTAYISNIQHVNDTIIVEWSIIVNGIIYFDTSYYEIDLGLGNYIFQISLHCPQKNNNNIAVFTQSAVIDEFTILNEFIRNDFLIYPNPTHNQLNIKTSLPSYCKIVSLDGSIILEDEVIDYKTIDFSNFESGVYMIELSNDNGIIVKRIIKN